MTLLSILEEEIGESPKSDVMQKLSGILDYSQHFAG